MHPFQWSAGTCKGPPPWHAEGGVPLLEFAEGPGRNLEVLIPQDPCFGLTIWLEQTMKGEVCLCLYIEIVAGRLPALSGVLVQQRRKNQPELPGSK